MDTGSQYFDNEKCCYNTVNVKSGTILADPEIFFLRTLGSWNNTVIHECVHWLKHRKHIELERLHNQSINHIICPVEEINYNENKENDIAWMEWQANSLAPRILMPFEQFKRKADELIKYPKKEMQTKETSDVIIPVIYDLQDFFGVSVQSAKIRMIDIGYTEAIGVLEYTDGQYVPQHKFKKDSVRKGFTYSIPMKEGLYEYARNLEFRELIDTGRFVYINSHYCVNDPKYVILNENDTLEMTDYALNDMEECCLIFKRTVRINPEFGAAQYKKSALFQNAVKRTIPEYSYNHNYQTKSKTDFLSDVENQKLLN